LGGDNSRFLNFILHVILISSEADT
jgi:hypothetical protein